jgi:O-antigen ligase
VNTESVNTAYRRAIEYYRSTSGFTNIVPLIFLLISFFYCLPLGRYNVGGFDSDFRIYDFMILLVFGFYLLNQDVAREISRILHVQDLFTKWIKWLIVLLILSIFIATFYSGITFLLPRLIRLYRFISYLIVPFFVIAAVRTRTQYLTVFNTFFLLTAVTALIAFLQGLNYLPNFWPEYWVEMYSENDAPVATLSPHHKHIGVVMLVGVCIGLGYFLIVRNFFLKFLIAVSILVMFTVPLFAGTRTYLLGFVGVFPALIYIGRVQFIASLTFLVIIAYFTLSAGGEQITERVEQKFEKRVASRVERFGYEGLYRERTVIYEDILRAIIQHPYLLLTGTGYQNIFSFIGANGAHNNYLQAMMELGLLGFFVFISFLVLLWRNLKWSMKIKDRQISILSQYTWVAFAGILMTMFVGETIWGQAAMFTLAGQLSFLFALAISPLYWISRYQKLFTTESER